MSLFAWMKALSEDAEYCTAMEQYVDADARDDDAGREAALAKMEERSEFYSGKPLPKDAH